MRIRVDPVPTAARTVRDAVVSFAREHRVDEERLSDLLTAIGEALANAVEHSATSCGIDVSCSISGDRIVAEIRDYGRGFDPAAHAENRLPDASSERGRGFPIMRSYSDLLTVASKPGQGTAVIVARFLAHGTFGVSITRGTAGAFAR